MGEPRGLTRSVPRIGFIGFPMVLVVLLFFYWFYLFLLVLFIFSMVLFDFLKFSLFSDGFTSFSIRKVMPAGHKRARLTQSLRVIGRFLATLFDASKAILEPWQSNL